MDSDHYPPAPSTPPEPAPPDPSMSNAARDPRSSMGSERLLMLQQQAHPKGLISPLAPTMASGVGGGIDMAPGGRRLVKASTMPAGSHTSLDDITCTMIFRSYKLICFSSVFHSSYLERNGSILTGDYVLILFDM